MNSEERFELAKDFVSKKYEQLRKYNRSVNILMLINVILFTIGMFTINNLYFSVLGFALIIILDKYITLERKYNRLNIKMEGIEILAGSEEND